MILEDNKSNFGNDKSDFDPLKHTLMFDNDLHMVLEKKRVQNQCIC